MFYVSKARSCTEVYVVDTNDMVEECYSYNQLKSISDSGVSILGFRRNVDDVPKYSINTCSYHNGLLFESCRQENKLFIYNSKGLCDTFKFESVHDYRNDVWFDGGFKALSKFNSKDYILLRLNAWVKYDIEFCGSIFVLVSKLRYVTDRTEVLFINDGDYSDEELEEFQGDYPDFITSSEVPINMTKGIFKGKKY